MTDPVCRAVDEAILPTQLREAAVYIDRIDVYLVAMPLISPWRTAYGEDSVIESVLVKMTSGDLAGWGEASPLAAPTYSPEWAGGVFSTVKRWLAPPLAGLERDRI